MQSPQRRVLYSVILLFGLVWIAMSAKGSEARGTLISAPQRGFLAPEFSLTTLDGQTINLSNLRGRVVLVNFWASWCPPCRAEMPAMERMQAEYQNQGLTILAVNAAFQDSQAEVERFAEENRLTFPILLDTNGQVNRLYAVRSLPTSFFIGRDGVIRDVVIGGPMSEALLHIRIENLLKETP